MDKLLLEYEIKSNGHSIIDFCNAIGINKTTYYRKVQGKSDFTQKEIQKAIDYLNLDDAKIRAIFFTQKVS